MRELKNILYINNKKVKNNGKFAYDGCHKIYILEDETDLQKAIELGYIIININMLEKTYFNSCDLRFISNWKLTQAYSNQFQHATFIRSDKK